MRGLSLGLGLTGKRPSKGPLCDAINEKVCVSATYKRKSVVLAPYVVFVRNGENRLAATEINGNRRKIAIFKVADLSDIQVLSDTPFAPDPGFDPNDPQFGNEIICIVQMV